MNVIISNESISFSSKLLDKSIFLSNSFSIDLISFFSIILIHQTYWYRQTYTKPTKNYRFFFFLKLKYSIVNGIDDISILRYYEGGKYVTHVDHSRAVPRTLSAILLLNNEYEGGELKFFYPCGKLMKEVKPALGRLIIWPSNFLYPHAVEPIKRGIRYSIVSWAQ